MRLLIFSSHLLVSTCGGGWTGGGGFGGSFFLGCSRGCWAAAALASASSARRRAASTSERIFSRALLASAPSCCAFFAAFSASSSWAFNASTSRLCSSSSFLGMTSLTISLGGSGGLTGGGGGGSDIRRLISACMDSEAFSALESASSEALTLPSRPPTFSVSIPHCCSLAFSFASSSASFASSSGSATLTSIAARSCARSWLRLASSASTCFRSSAAFSSTSRHLSSATCCWCCAAFFALSACCICLLSSSSSSGETVSFSSSSKTGFVFLACAMARASFSLISSFRYSRFWKSPDHESFHQRIFRATGQVTSSTATRSRASLECSRTR
mmetsp:Transcript_96649/g.288613  ORF Transcript_96649/g.288613 Transcript_96649/m.288613 type:complete len:330 (-) Transcript_96649:250-1239(-)